MRLTRRLFFSAVFTLPAAAMAHDGHDLSKLVAEVGECRSARGGMAMRLSITNGRETAVQLQAIYSDMGAVSADFPLPVGAGGTASVDLWLPVSDWPGIFTLVLDFGAAGQGPVTVIPV